MSVAFPLSVAQRLVILVLVLSGEFTACSKGDPAEVAGAGCGKVERTAVQFPANHVLPGTPEPRYLSEPPTSGPHLVPPQIQARYDELLSRPIQVGILESGKLLVQYRDARDAVLVGAFAGGDVVVAPNSSLDQPVVLTAWLHLQRCQSVNATVIGEFRRQAGLGAPGQHS